jgi:hypothetical protein
MLVVIQGGFGMAIISWVRQSIVMAVSLFTIFGLACLVNGERQVAFAQPKENGSLDRILRQAFGPDCNELNRAIRLSLPGNELVIAADTFQIEKDGRVRLAPFSVAFLQKVAAPGAHPEIITIRCDAALIKLDEPVLEIADLAKRQILNVDMQSLRTQLLLRHNRGTATKADDLELFVPDRSLHFDRTGNLLKCDGVALLIDRQTKTPTELRGRGLEIKLSKPAAEGSLLPVRFERLSFRSEVEARFGVNAASGFLAVPMPGFPMNVDAEARVKICANGPMTYQLEKGLVKFEILANPKENGRVIAQQTVEVERRQDVGKMVFINQLECDRLELQFGLAGGAVHIAKATATSQVGDNVTVCFDYAFVGYGSSYSYESAGVGKSASQAIRGTPLSLVSDGNKMTCAELRIITSEKDGKESSITAAGPGQLDFVAGSGKYDRHVTWRDKLVIANGAFGLYRFNSLTAHGAASFVDDRNGQEVSGEQITISFRREKQKPKER